MPVQEPIIDADRDLVLAKLGRATDRGFLRTVDLFAGCGGMTLGFHRAGFRCVAAVEIDDDARASHEANFAGRAGEGGYKAHADIKKTAADEAVSHFNPLFPEICDSIDVVIGGPPCQAFSRLGRAALWKLAGKSHAHGADERATMYEHFLAYVARLKPLAFVMENVREIGKYVGKNIAEEIAVTAEDAGYDVQYTLLNSVWFGVPQMRERAFIVGIHKALETSPAFPLVRFKYDLPVGYSTSRAGEDHVEFLEPHDHYVDHMAYARSCEAATTVQEAFADLPPICFHLDGRKGKGVKRDPDAKTAYSSGTSDFSKAMRGWPGFRNPNNEFSGQIIRYTPRDYEIFRRMPHGGMYPEALETAEKIFQERLEEARRLSGQEIPIDSKEWKALRKSIVPPYKSGRYPNKFRKMWPDHPARTLPAHIGKDSYSHIHFDSDQARCISLREAARIQSFPDAFKLVGSMNSRLRQIGNAVPPLLAYAVARSLASSLKQSSKKMLTSFAQA